MKRDEVIRILQEHQKDFMARYNVVYLSLFGSVVRGETHPGGGVGILVKFAHPTGLLQFIELKKRIEALLGCKVEMGKPRELKQEFRARVMQEAVRVF